jgi:hypothetical protein
MRQAVLPRRPGVRHGAAGPFRHREPGGHRQPPGRRHQRGRGGRGRGVHALRPRRPHHRGRRPRPRRGCRLRGRGWARSAGMARPHAKAVGDCRDAARIASRSPVHASRVWRRFGALGRCDERQRWVDRGDIAWVARDDGCPRSLAQMAMLTSTTSVDPVDALPQLRYYMMNAVSLAARDVDEAAKVMESRFVIAQLLARSSRRSRNCEPSGRCSPPLTGQSRRKSATLTSKPPALSRRQAGRSVEPTAPRRPSLGPRLLAAAEIKAVH